MIVENNTFIPTATNPSHDEDKPRMLRRDTDQIQCNVEVNYIQANSIINPGQFKKDNAPVAAGRASL